MNKVLFQKIFNNSVLSKLIFNLVHHIHFDLLKQNHCIYKWKDVINTPYVLSGHGYLELLKEYLSRNNKNMCVSFIDYSYNYQILVDAVRGCNGLHILKFLLDELRIDPYKIWQSQQNTTEDLMYFAAKHGRLEIIYYLVGKYSRWDFYNAITVAPLSGNMELLKFIGSQACETFENTGAVNFENYLTTTYDSAALVGRIDFIQWLQENRSQDLQLNNCRLYNSAIEGGHLPLLRYLVENKIGYEKLGNIFDYATLQKQPNTLDILEFLQIHFKTGFCTQAAMNNAASTNNMEVLRWLHNNRSEGCSSKAMNEAAKNNNFDMLKWLNENRSEGCTNYAIENAIYHQNIEMIQYLHVNRPECSELTFELYMVYHSGIRKAKNQNNYKLYELLMQHDILKLSADEYI
ncbi:hypothetical protein PPL_11399 [Heterostelium album PN500]|uniref:Ankyrin repeat protein n=1 Tax=Heterostelium pallidum (strain ATCC 26659 / Pp 5 / PN500) TaxID=670386 RepID=D3BTA6_HETP5|nr:hypothetical protein PPL_11399 [Heterostelium album PN500]EFA75323.1 hypothetical protein PPL_11399 [Heterostelium album PN500]|eukprot:XP_020427457.1 hypothetical protein PPL_11399 [Heterostelium album PN500]